MASHTTWCVFPGDSDYFGITADSVARFRTGFEQPINLAGGGWMVGGALGYDDLGHNFVDKGRAMFEAAGVKDISASDNHQAPGLDIHEMGGVRMGTDPNTPLLNAHNQLHQCRNVYVTDGACMTSTGSQSPSILYMALTARTVHHAAAQLKQGQVG